jgi:SAM-dependent methyltransferase
MDPRLVDRLVVDREVHVAIVSAHSMPRSRAFTDLIVEQMFWNVDLEEDLKPGMKVLELGLGQGHVLRGLIWQYKVQGIGIDLDNITLRGIPSIEVVEANLEDGIPFGDEEFDLVYSVQVFPYIIKKMALLREAHRVTRLGGNILFDTTSRFGNELIRPDIRKILKAYPNEDQIDLDYRRHVSGGICLKSIHIEKTSGSSLVFPELVEARYLMDPVEHGEDFVPQVSSTYSLS